MLPRQPIILAHQLELHVNAPGKAALISLDLGPYGITVNCLGPGPFLTDRPGKLLNDEEKQYFTDRTAVKHWAAPWLEPRRL